MILAFTFVTPLLLIGLAAAGIPPLLHLLSRVRAKEEPFPTLRFLQHCMEKTARRRRIEHWLLLLLRMAALALLAVALAEPISKAAGWAGGGDDVAALLIDNSDSMALGQGYQTRLARAKSELTRQLRDPAAPAMSAVIATTDSTSVEALSTQLEAQRRKAEAVAIDFGPNHLAERFAQAVKLLAGQSNPKRSIYYFGDLQRKAIAPLLDSPALAEAAGMKLFFLDASRGEVDNVGITNVSVQGPCIADAPVTFRVTILNSSSSPRRVDVAFRPDDRKQAVRKISQDLAATGQDGADATLTFTHPFAQPGWSLGEIRIEQADDLLADNTWRYCVDVSPHVRALVVRSRGSDDPGAMLSLALDWRDETQAGQAWPIRVMDMEASDVTPESLASADAAFFCDVPTFTPRQADALKQFVQAGGTVWFFLGPDVNIGEYNARFGTKGAGLLPGVLGEPVGQVGPGGKVWALSDVAEDHPLFADLFDAPADYRTTRTQRYVSFQPMPSQGRVLMSLSDNQPLLVEHAAGRGWAYWCMTTADPRWSNLPTQPIFLPMVVRSAMQSARNATGPAMYTAGQVVEIRPDPRATAATQLRVTPPNTAGTAKPITIIMKNGLTTFSETAQLGVYRWEALGKDQNILAGGAFAVNPYGPESDLAAFAPAQLEAELHRRGCTQACVATTLDDLHAVAAAASQGRNYWDVLVAAVLLLLLAEALAANRRKEEVRSLKSEVRNQKSGV